MARPSRLEIDKHIRIPLSEFTFHFARSGGPGGQNVNKLSTKVTLRWPLADSEALPDDVKARLVKQQSRRINVEGELIVSSQRYRYQSRNVTDCLEKLRAMLQKAAVPPKARRPTRPTKASKVKRRQAKVERSQRKRFREKPEVEE
jgi:ribosome-associated protein